MKLINVYKQDDINWFGYKQVFGYTRKLIELPLVKELKLKSWIKKDHLGITKRKPNEIN